MSDTPRTDAVYFRSGSTKYDLAGEMKELERENAALRERVDAWKEEAIEHGAKLHTLERDNNELRAELEAQAVVNGKGGEREAKLLAEVAALRKALEEAFAESDDTVRFHIIRNAVEALKEAQP